MDFDATSFYPSAMWDDISLYPERETGHAFTSEMNDSFLEKFINQTFTQGSVILEVRYYKAPDLIFQHLPVKEKVKKQVFSRMKNGFIFDTLTSDDFQ